LLAAYADNAQQLLPKHVAAAIEDTNFGRKQINYHQYFIYTLWLAGLLSLALALAWWQVMPYQAMASQDWTDTIQLIAPKDKPERAAAGSHSLPSPVAALDADPSQLQRNARLAATTVWLQHAPPDTVTLQIQSLSEDAGLNAELDRLSRLIAIDHIYLYRKKQDGLIYIIFLYGAFTQRRAALAAADNLPSEIKRHQPYLRTVAGIKNDINQK
jgi:septal ring-binding cell division protein DamX